MLKNLNLGTRVSLLLAAIIIVCMATMTFVIIGSSTAIQKREAKKLLSNVSLRMSNLLMASVNQTFAFLDGVHNSIEANLSGGTTTEAELEKVIEDMLDANDNANFGYLYLKPFKPSKSINTLKNGEFMIVRGDSDIDNEGGLYTIPASEQILQSQSLQKALKTQGNTIGTPTFADLDGKGQKLLSGLNIPIKDKQGRVIGVLGLVISMDRVNSWMQNGNLSVFDGDYRFIMTEDGDIGVHPSQDALGKNTDEHAQALKQVAKAHDSGIYEYKTIDKRDALVGLSSLQLYNTGTYWSAMVVAPLDEIMQPVYSLRNLIVLCVVISLLIVIISVFFYIKQAVVSRLKVVSNLLVNFFKYLNHETSTPPSLVTPKANDEIGGMVLAINQNIANTQKGLEQDKQAIAQSAQTAKDIESGKFSARITAIPHNPQLVELKNVLNAMLDVLQNHIGRDMNEIQRVFDSFVRLDFTTEIANANGRVELVTNTLGQEIKKMLSSSASFANSLSERSNELAESMQRLTESSSQQAAALGQSATAVEEISSSMQNVSSKAQEVTQQTEDIRNIVGIIKDIADQTC